MKTAIITGGIGGIGYAISAALSESGFKTVIFDMADEAAAAEKTAQLKECVYVRGNLTKAEDRERLVNAAEKIDLLVNCAGVAPRVRADILEVTEEDFDFVTDINIKGTFFLTQLAAKKMIEDKTNGRIVNISSMSAYTSSVNRPQYCISKAGVSMITKLYADKLAEFGIGVYEIRPGIIKTDMTKTVEEKYDKLIYNEGILPIGRWGLPEDIAKAVNAIACGALPYSTGEVINVDGGFHLRRL